MALPFSLHTLFSGESSIKRVLSELNDVDPVGFENNRSARTLRKISLELLKPARNFRGEVSILVQPSCPSMSKGGLKPVKRKPAMSSTVVLFMELQMTTQSPISETSARKSRRPGRVYTPFGPTLVGTAKEKTKELIWFGWTCLGS